MGDSKIKHLAISLILVSFLLFSSPIPAIVSAWEREGFGEVKVYKYHYDREKAIEYAKSWTYTRNPEFRDFGEHDCANFVSQCLLAGGWPIVGNWWDSLFGGWRSYQVWFYFNSFYTPYFNIYQGWSNTWSVANDLSIFILESKRGESLNKVGEIFTPLSKDFLKSLLDEDRLQKGDIVFIDYERDYIMDHVMIITNTDKEKSDVTIAEHTQNTGKSCSLLDLICEIRKGHSDAQFYAYHLRDQFDK